MSKHAKVNEEGKGNRLDEPKRIDHAASGPNAQDALFVVAMEGLSQQQATPMPHRRQNIGRQAPLEFRVVERSSEQWKAIKQAIIAERRAVRRGVPLDQERAAVLEAIRNDAAVSAAAARLASDLSAVQGIFAEFGIDSTANAG